MARAFWIRGLLCSGVMREVVKFNVVGSGKFWVDAVSAGAWPGLVCNRLLISFNFADNRRRCLCVNKSNYNTIQFPR